MLDVIYKCFFTIKFSLITFIFIQNGTLLIDDPEDQLSELEGLENYPLQREEPEPEIIQNVHTDSQKILDEYRKALEEFRQNKVFVQVWN